MGKRQYRVHGGAGGGEEGLTEGMEVVHERVDEAALFELEDLLALAIVWALQDILFPAFREVRRGRRDGRFVSELVNDVTELGEAGRVVGDAVGVVAGGCVEVDVPLVDRMLERVGDEARDLAVRRGRTEVERTHSSRSGGELDCCTVNLCFLNLTLNLPWSTRWNEREQSSTACQLNFKHAHLALDLRPFTSSFQLTG